MQRCLEDDAPLVHERDWKDRERKNNLCKTVDLSFGDLESQFAAADAIVELYEDGPRIEYAGGRAYYKPSEDLVRLPEPARFVDPESFYTTIFHELAHSTGHVSRLDRGLGTTSSTSKYEYSKEELIAETGAAFLAAAAGISPPTIEQSAAYIDSWRNQLKADKKLVVQAAGAGQRAADWILGVYRNGPGDSEDGPTVDP